MPRPKSVAFAPRKALASVLPNLNVYVPARALLLGEVTGVSLSQFVWTAAAHALFYAGAVITLSALIFARRDFQ